jgi:predicted ATP-grasp superfamily ATP-dependent carboligase
MKPIPAVLLPYDEHMGLDIARSLGRHGIPVYAVDPASMVSGSKYCSWVRSPDPREAEEEFLEFLLHWTETLGSKAVLYPLSDESALLCARERSRLQSHYEYVMPDYTTMVRLSTKAGLAAAARECSISAPQTVFPGDVDEVQGVAGDLTYPVILKPVESAYWHQPQIAARLRESLFSGRPKVIICYSAQELIQAYRDIAIYDDRMIIQEVIPGPDENLSYISFYLGRESEPLALFAGRKLRVIPTGFGSASYVRSFRDPELEKVAIRFLSQVRYQGLGGLEFKKDTRDGCYKLIEFNTRFGMWDGLGVRCGVDTPYIAYRDALRLPIERQTMYREGVIWIDLQRDVRAFWMYRKQGRLSLRQWLQSLRGEKMWAIYSRDDWRPGIVFTLNMIREFLRRLWHSRRQG